MYVYIYIYNFSEKIALLLTSFISEKIPKISQHIKVASLQEHKRS